MEGLSIALEAVCHAILDVVEALPEMIVAPHCVRNERETRVVGDCAVIALSPHILV